MDSLRKDSEGRFAAPIMGLLGCAILYLVCAVISFTVLAEDAYISFRYAENIAEGWGPVFNRGGPAVEGYSNPLWVWILAAVGGVGLTEVVSRCLGLAFGVLSLVELSLLTGFFERKRERVFHLPPAVLACWPPFLFWSQSGLETGLYVYLLLLAWRLVIEEGMSAGRIPWSMIPVILLGFTRPEGVLFVVIFWALKVMIIKPESGVRGGKMPLIWTFVVFMAIIIFFLWRYYTFGVWLPNTFYAKVNNGFIWKAREGSKYLGGFLYHSFGIPLVAPILACLFGSGKEDVGKRKVAVSALLVACGQIIFVIYVGGDIHPNDRFAIPLGLASLVFTFALLEGNGESTKWLTRSIGVLFIFGNLAYWFPFWWDVTPPIRFSTNFLSVNTARLLTREIELSKIWGEFVKPRRDGLDLVGLSLQSEGNLGRLLATDQCGKIPYRSGMETVDLFGLNDREIARIVHSNRKWEEYAGEVLSRSADVFLVFYRDGHLVSKYYLENTVLSSPFRRRYFMDRVYKINYSFVDFWGMKHTFTHELLLFRKNPNWESTWELTREEETWLSSNQPIVDTPDALRGMVEDFVAANWMDPSKVVRFWVDLN